MALFKPQVAEGPTVLEYGADPFGFQDSTAAFTNAHGDTPQSSPIRIPAGTYLLDAGGVVPITARMWIGDVSSTGQPISTLKARTSDINFLSAGSRTFLMNLVIDAAGLADRALRLLSAHRTIIFNVDCRNALEWALLSNETNTAPITRLTCRNSAQGAQFIGANGMNIIDMRILDNTGLGVEFVGVRAPETDFSGQMNVFGFRCEGNGGVGVRVRGVTEGLISGGRIHGNGSDGIVLDDGTADVMFQALHIDGDGAGGEVAIRSTDALLCTFQSVNVKGDNPSFERAILTEPSSVMQFYGCRKSDGSPLDLVYTDGVTSYTANPDGANLKASSVPTRGTFRRGHLAWNGTPTAASNRGWRCTSPGSPGTWSSF